MATGVSSPSRPRAEALSRELAPSAGAAAYAKGLAETPKFSPECFDLTCRDLEKKVDKLLEIHRTTPWVGEILAALKQKTGRG